MLGGRAGRISGLLSEASGGLLLLGLMLLGLLLLSLLLLRLLLLSLLLLLLLQDGVLLLLLQLLSLQDVLLLHGQRTALSLGSHCLLSRLLMPHVEKLLTGNALGDSPGSATGKLALLGTGCDKLGPHLPQTIQGLHCQPKCVDATWHSPRRTP